MSVLPPLLSDRCCNLDLLVSPKMAELAQEQVEQQPHVLQGLRSPAMPTAPQIKAYGPGLSGGLFGAAWWFWIDACAASGVSVPFLHYLPGIVATVALLMINCVRREDLLEEYDSYDEGVFCRSRTWLLISYLVSALAIMLSVWVFLRFYAAQEVVWPGVAGLLQVTLILGAALLFWLGRTPLDDPAEGGFSSF